MKSKFSLICSILTINAMSQVNFFIIPQNEKTAEKLIVEGKLDAEIFELIRPFYIQPLDVPQGELKILLELLPQLSSELPASIDSLEKYKPWDEPSILRFFLDYPIVAQFEPILRFDIKPVDFRAKAAFSVNSQGDGTQFSQGANLQVCLLESFRLDTRITFNNDHALWDRRAFILALPQVCSLQVGNFGSFFDHGLFWGHFHRSESDSSFVYNWLYGNAATWNGIKLRVGGKDTGFLNRFSTMAFFHKRGTETAAGGIFSLKPNDLFCFNSGLSMLHLRDTLCKALTFRYVHYGMKLNTAWFNAELQSGFDVQNPGCMPLFFDNKFSLSRNEIDITYVFLPKGIRAPCSYLVHKIDNKNQVITNGVSSITLQSVHNPCQWCWIIPSAYLVFTKQTTEKLCFNFCIRGSFRNFMYDATYSWLPSSALTDTSGNSFHNVLSIFPTRKISIKTETDFNSKNCNGHLFSGCISSKVDLFPAISLRPSVFFSKSGGKSLLIAYGFEHVLKLQEKIFTQFKIEQNIKPREKGDFPSVDAKTSFVF